MLLDVVNVQKPLKYFYSAKWRQEREIQDGTMTLVYVYVSSAPNVFVLIEYVSPH